MWRPMLLVLTLILVPAPGSASALVPEDITLAPSCARCGMDRVQAAHARMLVTYADRSRVGTCSLHCLAGELAANPGKQAVTIEAADYIGKELIDARQSHWVVGGNRPPVMGSTAAWAFAGRIYADKFIREHGGTLASFDQALAMARQELAPTGDQPGRAATSTAE